MTPTTLEAVASVQLASDDDWLHLLRTNARTLAMRISTLPAEQQASVLATLFEALALAGVDMEMAGCVLEEARHG